MTIIYISSTLVLKNITRKYSFDWSTIIIIEINYLDGKSRECKINKFEMMCVCVRACVCVRVRVCACVCVCV